MISYPGYKSTGLVPKNDIISSDHYPSILSILIVISISYRHGTRSYFVFHIVLLSWFSPALYAWQKLGFCSALNIVLSHDCLIAW